VQSRQSNTWLAIELQDAGFRTLGGLPEKASRKGGFLLFEKLLIRKASYLFEPLKVSS
jgi:hypothetical protein